jgi:hypothetical protein
VIPYGIYRDGRSDRESLVIIKQGANPYIKGDLEATVKYSKFRENKEIRRIIDKGVVVKTRVNRDYITKV